jgi:FkbM family methyltransferase
VLTVRAIKAFLKSRFPEQTLLHLQALDHYFNGEAEVRLIAQLCPIGREAIDAGANIGTYSYFLRKYAKRVYAYEPNPDLAARLTRLLPDVTVRNVALSDKPGQVVLKIPVDSDGNVQHELASISQEFGGPVREFQVDSITIDSENLADIGFLKVDVEQHEREVLHGALSTIERCRPVIMTEISPLKYGQGLREVFSFLTDMDYVGWFKFNQGWLPLHLFNDDVHANKEHFGNSRAFAGTNLLLFPSENALAQTGPQRWRNTRIIGRHLRSRPS